MLYSNYNNKMHRFDRLGWDKQADGRILALLNARPLGHNKQLYR